MTDPHFFDVRYTGRVPLTSITFDGETASPTALGRTASSRSSGIVFDPRPLVVSDNLFRGVGFPFTVGSASGGLTASQVAARFSVPFGSSGEYQHLTISFAHGLARGGKLQFGVDRDLARSGFNESPSEGNGADELGGAVLVPQACAESTGVGRVAFFDRALKGGASRADNAAGPPWSAGPEP